MTHKALEIQEVLNEGRLEEGLEMVNEALEQYPDDPLLIFIAGVCQMRMGNQGVAFSLFERSHKLKPDQAETINNMGVCLYDCSHFERARAYYKQAYEMNNKDPDFLSNLCSVDVGLGDFKKAIYWAEKGLKIAPDNKDILYNSALAYLTLGDYKKGWERYDISLGNRFRQERYFDHKNEIPRWDGSEVEGDVVVYGEQGLGDEIMFASILPDAMKKAHVILECDRRLQGLFRRSFPELTVYGTRFDNELYWPEYHNIKAKCDMGHLGTLFRPDAKSMPRTKYLVADPERRTSYRALLDSIGPYPKVGIAWTGGRTNGDQSRRSIPLEVLKPLLKEDIHWIDLEYKDRSLDIHRFVTDSGIPINHFPWITFNSDYDSTAALVAELDAVVCVPTTVGELAGALNVPCYYMSPWVPSWRVGNEGSEHPWYESVKVIRQKKEGEWGQVLTEVRKCMLSSFADRGVTTPRAA